MNFVDVRRALRDLALVDERGRLRVDPTRSAIEQFGSEAVLAFLLEIASEVDPSGDGLHADIVSLTSRELGPVEDMGPLFALYRHVDDASPTVTVIAWTLGRFGVDRLVEGMRPYAVTNDPAQRLAATRLTRLAASVGELARPDLGTERAPTSAGVEEEPKAAPQAAEQAARTMAEPPPPPPPQAEPVPPMTIEAEPPGPAPSRRRGLWRRRDRGGTTRPPSVEAAPPPDEEPAGRPTPPRWLNARIVRAATDGPALPALRAGAPHDVHVVLDVPRPGWLTAAGQPEESVDTKLARGVSHELTVTLWIAGSDEVLTESMSLPPLGPSDPVTFRITAPPAGDRIDATITLFHNNRALQAAAFVAWSFDDPSAVPDGREATLRLAVIRPGTDDLETRQPFDAALLAAVGERGTAGVAVRDGNAVQAFEAERLGPIADRIRTILRRLSDDAASFVGGLEADASVGLLRALAYQGRDLYDLVGRSLDPVPSPGAPKRIQVVVTDAEAFVPIEFVYDFLPPAPDAGLCPNWRRALIDGECAAENHPMSALPGLARIVCPLGFWALKNVIERHVVDFEEAESLEGRDFGIRAEPSSLRGDLHALTAGVVAWSDKVNLAVPGQSDAVVQAITGMTGRPALAVRAWEEWVETIRTQAPPLLVLLSHTVSEQGTPALEIGPEEGGSRCLRVQLVTDYVKARADDTPVVLLLGCDTAVARGEPQTFVARFREAGAALVVGTVAPVLGENAAPVATALLAELRSAIDAPAPGGSGERTVGEAILRVRRALVGTGHLTALCITAVGDADWRLASRAPVG